MKILISGSDTFDDYSFLDKGLTDIISKEQYYQVVPNSGIEIVSGNTPKGTEYLSKRWSKKHNLKIIEFKTDWNEMNPKIPANWGNNPAVMDGDGFYGKYNKLSGYLRNQRVTNYIWPDGISIIFDMGTPDSKDIVRRCKRQGIKTYQITFKNDEWKTKIWNGE